MLLGLTVVLAGSARIAQTAGPDEIHVARATRSAFAFAVFEVGNDAHIWDKVGLKLDIASFNGDAQVQQGMTAGQVDFGLGGGPAMGYHAKGVPGIAIASMYGPPTDMAIVIANNGGVKTIADLKGKKLGVTTAGSLTDWLVHELARRQGWGPNGIDSEAMGSTEARVSALETGQIAGSVQDIGVGYDLEAQGKGSLRDLRFVRAQVRDARHLRDGRHDRQASGHRAALPARLVHDRRLHAHAQGRDRPLDRPGTGRVRGHRRPAVR